MRSAEAERARFTWLTPKAFGERLGVSDQHVRDLIAKGWFGKGECIDVSLPGAKVKRYHIAPAALDRFLRERAA
jgi:hypothetical protein